MILGANFESEWGPEIPLNVELLNTFGGHVTMKKGTTWLLLTKKGATCDLSPSLLAPTESPKRFPHRSSAPTVQRLSPGPAACPTSAAARDRVPDSRCGFCFKATPSQGRAGGGEAGCGRARLGLDWCGRLEQPHGRLLAAARCWNCRCHGRISNLDLGSSSFRLLQALPKAERLPKKFEDVRPVRQPV